MATTVVKEGPIAVRGHFMWRDRYVTIHDNQLTIQRSKHGAVKGKIDLADPSVQVVFHENQTQFTITTAQGRDVLFQCPTTTVRDEWLGAVFVARGPSDTDAESDAVFSTMDERTGVTQDESEASEIEAVFLSREPSCDSNDDGGAYNDTLMAFQNLRSSMMEFHFTSIDEDTEENNQEPAIVRQQEEATRRRCVNTLAFFIQSVPHGGKAVLLHMDVLSQSFGITLDEIVAVLGETQCEKPRRGSMASVGLQKLHVATFVRYILFHPIYNKRQSGQADRINELVDRYFPHCRLRRFSHDVDQDGGEQSRASEPPPHTFELDLTFHTPPTTHQQTRNKPNRPDPSVMKRKRHSFPNIMMPISLSGINSNNPIRAMAPPVPLLPQRSRSESMSSLSMSFLLPAANNDSDAFRDDVIVEPLRQLLWRYSLQDVVEQLSLLHHRQIASNVLWEFITAPKQAAKAITEHFNRFVSYLVWSVLIEDTPKDRAEVIESIIAMAVAASELNNFHLVMACVGCLGDLPLMPARLPLTWKKVRVRFKTHLQALRTLCDHTGGFETLRKRQAAESTRSSCMPFIGVIGVALERLRLTPYYSEGSGRTVNLDRLGRQYTALLPMENAILKAYKFSAIDTLQTTFERLDMSFSSSRLLQLRSQQILTMENAASNASLRTSSLYRNRKTELAAGDAGDDSPPFLSFHQICCILATTASSSERIQICVEALLTDDRQALTRSLRSFWRELRQTIHSSACHVAVHGTRRCVESLHRGILTQKSNELQQVTGLDELAVELDRGVYAAVVAAVTQPIATWFFAKVKHSLQAEDMRLLSKIKSDNTTSPTTTHSSSVVVPIETDVAPLAMLDALTQAIQQLIPLNAPQDLRAAALLAAMAQRRLMLPHPASVLYVLQQTLDVLFLSRPHRDALELFDTALSSLTKAAAVPSRRASSAASMASVRSIASVRPLS
ncbi:hypothetical protein Poli38472_006109 [Pythium oligandrum]|uniref:Ras-GEF domain-containing protein n=1 Tax=Pythium oligandrum TaxID=41045 RepID=A0A8K1FMU5_PYTOL|nr:hypothetical protein Poli38472_006109 [Pythium oligandrum]|eukprot:TMW68641.1 hypothetical protein Poli38472_006109 [Pythium oligandrum]